MPKIAEEARAARRDQIVAAAAECFARAGYRVTTMADIAEAAGVSKGTPYLYFPGKEALFIALYEEWDCGLAARVDAAVGRARRGRAPVLSPRAGGGGIGNRRPRHREPADLPGTDGGHARWPPTSPPSPPRSKPRTP